MTSSAEIAFRPEEGARWRKSFVFEQEMDLDVFRVVMNGQDVPGDFLPQMEMKLRSEGTTILADRYGPLAEGRPAPAMKARRRPSGVVSRAVCAAR